ncbi:hypothetical protein C6497_02005 [Candidatus Poribacteria bacterium]|nr:MAG: hypothetical protein C6497_02005 [Candidatus Poribacteria bacterium]
MKKCRMSRKIIILIVLIVLHLIPVWCFKYFPTQDGASHIYNAYVLKEYHHPDNSQLREVYELNSTLFPNWTSHALLLILMYIFPPIICEKVVLSLCIVLLPLSLFYFINGFKNTNTYFGLVGFIFAYNYLLHMGFYNFVLSMSIFFFTLGYWWRIKKEMSVYHIVMIYIQLLLIYFTHFHSYVLLLFAMTFLAIYLFLYEIVKDISSENPESNLLLPRLRESITKVKSVLIFLGILLPAYFMFLNHYLYLADKHVNKGYKGFEWLWDYFLSMKSLVSFRDEHILIGQTLLLVLTIAFILTIIYRIFDTTKNEESKSNNPKWTLYIMEADGLFILSMLITVLYFITPWSGFSGGWINDRFHLYIYLVLLPFFFIPHHKRINHVIAGMIIVLSLWHLGLNIQTYSLLNRDIKEALSLNGIDNENTILMSIPGEWNGTSDQLGFVPKYVAPFGHIECHLIINKGVAYLNNYEANTDHFPLRYKNKDLPADYVIVWRTAYDDVEGLEEEYEMIDSTNYNRLYRRKP